MSDKSEPERQQKKRRIDSERVWREDDKAAEFVSDARWNLSTETVTKCRDYLKSNGIETIQDWRECGDEGRTLLLETVGFSIRESSKITEFLLMKIQEPLDDEQKLNKKLLWCGSGKLLEDDLTRQGSFVRDAVSVETPQTFTRRRGDRDIRIVLGPSGSGKTLYALNTLALQGNLQQESGPAVGVYFSLHEHEEKSFENAFTTSTYIKDQTKMAIQASLGEPYDLQVKKNLNLKMLVSVIIDEAASYPEVMGDINVLSKTYDELKSIASHVRLIVAGTGMDGISMDLSSATDVFKYRMQPWKEYHFEKAAEKQNTPDTQMCVRAIIQSPILSKLITNARSAMFTIEAVLLIKRGYSSVDVKGSLTSIVHVVLGQYISSNGIGRLSDKEKRLLAFAVFHELKDANQLKKARFPILNKLHGEDGEDRIRRKALGVLDVNVESQGNTINFVGDHKVSVSITPALSMLLYKLLGVEATVYENWEGLEAIAGLHAAYLEVTTNPACRTMGVRLARLTRPVPAPSATKNFCIPSPSNTPTVFINGDKAPYLDAIAKNGGMQSKYSKGGESVDIDMDEELQKGGLVKNMLSLKPKSGEDAKKALSRSEKSFGMGKAVMSAFVYSWSLTPSSEDTGCTSKSVDQANLNDKSPETPNVFSPAFLFPKSSIAETEVDPNAILCNVTDDGVSLCKDQENLTLGDPSFTKPFTMTFLTNAKSMSLRVYGVEEFSLCKRDTDSEGKVVLSEDKEREESYQSLVDRLGLRDNVVICFVFTG